MQGLRKKHDWRTFSPPMVPKPSRSRSGVAVSGSAFAQTESV